MEAGEAYELGFRVLEVGDGEVGEEDCKVVRCEEEGREGAFGVEGGGGGLEGEACGHCGGDLRGVKREAGWWAGGGGDRRGGFREEVVHVDGESWRNRAELR
jgi:hypothetical protein